MGLLDSLLGNNARRFIKRKDSDAGEAGRALEELRGSLYNDIRTSEGAKRQQQRFCGPVVAMTFNFMAAVGVIMANKLVMKKVGFNFPIFLTLIHYSTSWILLGILRASSLLPVSPPSKTTPFAPLFSLGVVMAFASGLANASLNQNSVGFYQMSKIAVTPSIVLAEFVIFRKTISYKKVLALVVVSGGVAVATVKDLEFNFFGACIAIAWIVPSSINKILWSDLQQQANWTALGFDAMLGSTRSVIIQVGSLQLICYFSDSSPWLSPTMVWGFGTWGNLCNISCCSRTVQVLRDPARRFSNFWFGSWVCEHLRGPHRSRRNVSLHVAKLAGVR
uniref:Sugar phosphate transporter domain-containing protein n=1 Tax=Salix viminalis TaxID=40686 RepID=A0A6N2NB47_SALVM